MPVPSRNRKARPRRLRRLMIAVPVLGLLAWWGLALALVLETSKPRNSVIPERSELGGHAVQDVEIRTEDGVRLSAWWIRVDPDRAVVLAAGIGTSRLANVPAAEFYVAHGWSVLMPDLRGTGASDPERLSFGWHEAKDIAACRTFLGGNGATRIGVHARSLGAAAALYEAAANGAPDFFVLESPYSDIRLALAQRLPRVPLPELSFWPARVLAGILLDLDAGKLRPLDAIARCATPTLLLGGAVDRETRPAELEAMLAASPGSPKQLHLFEGARHFELDKYAPEEWNQVVDAFLATLPGGIRDR